MSTYKYNENLQFELPTGLLHFVDKNENGDEMNVICTEKIINDDGEAEYKDRIDITEYEVEPGKKSDKEIEKLFQQRNAGFGFLSGENPTTTYSLPNEKDAFFVSGRFNWEIYGMQFYNYISALFLVCNDNTAVAINVVNSRFGEERDLSKYEQLIDVIKTIKFHGKKLNVGNLTPQILYDKLEKSLDDFDDVSKTFGSEGELEGKIMEALGNILEDYEDDVQSDKFSRTLPDQTLYPHYYGLQDRMSSLGSLGVEVRMNTSGTEYQFINFSRVIKEREEDFWDEDQEEKEELPLQEILDANPIGYTLDETAKEMAHIFHVDSFIFNEKSDREAEIFNGLMQKAYMMSALRSFAWTLADYCKKNSKKPKDLELSLLLEMIDFIEACDWLNYSDKKYCKGLCSYQDLHIFFLPDAVSKSDKDKFLPSEEDYERVRKMRETFPAYDEMLSQVASLDKLRKDLEYIYPAINTLYNYLKKDRDTSEQLEGNIAIILYAWCALSVAASEPFFVEDGPMNYSFSQEDYDDNYDYDNDDDCNDDDYDYDDEDEDDSDDYYKDYAYDDIDFEIDSSGTLKEYNGYEKRVVVPSGVKTIGENCFSCNNITSIVLPYGLKTIEESAFDYITDLEHIELPSTLKTIGKWAFAGCEKLESIELPKSLVTIEDYAFKGCKNLKKINIPKSLKNIGNYVFEDCDNIKEVVFDDDITNITIQDFMPMSAKTIKLPKQLKTIGDEVFFDCEKLKEIEFPECLQEIGESAFAVCKSLESIKLPKELKRIGREAFVECSNLKNVKLSEGLNSIEDEVFKWCSDLETLDMPQKIKTIGQRTFEQSGIKSINWPKSTKQIEEKTFYKCQQLETIIFGEGLESVGESAFEECVKLEKINLPNTVKIIENKAFKNCELLKEIILSQNLEQIGKEAFNGCCNIEKLILTGSIKKIEKGAFKKCKQLTEVYVPVDFEAPFKDAFLKSVIFYVVKDSWADKYAHDENFKVKYIEEGEITYQQGLAYLSLGDIDSAKKVLKGYKDGKKIIEEYLQAKEQKQQAEEQKKQAEEEQRKNAVLEAQYREAISYKDARNYDVAKSIFQKIVEYKDSKALIEEIDKTTELRRLYFRAEQCELKEEFTEATRLFESLGDYSDSKERLERIKEKIEQKRIYLEAAKYEEEGNLNEAEKLFESLGNYSNSSIRLMWARKKIAEQKEKENNYSNANRMEEEGNLISAEKIFASLGDYSDSRERLANVRKKIGVCPYCGGTFKGLFTKKCSNCGRQKD